MIREPISSAGRVAAFTPAMVVAWVAVIAVAAVVASGFVDVLDGIREYRGELGTGGGSATSGGRRHAVIVR